MKRIHIFCGNQPVTVFILPRWFKFAGEDFWNEHEGEEKLINMLYDFSKSSLHTELYNGFFKVSPYDTFKCFHKRRFIK